jgi:hypothetical protein
MSLKSLNVLRRICKMQLFCLTDGSTTFDSKMAEIVMQLQQWAVVEFLVDDGEKLTCVQKCLLWVYGEAAVDVSVYDDG